MTSPLTVIEDGSTRRILRTNIRAATFHFIRTAPGSGFPCSRSRSTPTGAVTITIDPGTRSAMNGYTVRYVTSARLGHRPARARHRARRFVWTDPMRGRRVIDRYDWAMPKNHARTRSDMMMHSGMMEMPRGTMAPRVVLSPVRLNLVLRSTQRNVPR